MFLKMIGESKKFVLFFVCLSLIGMNLFAGTGSSGKLYSLPIAEMESILSDWFTQSGFTVQSAPMEMGKVKLSAVRSEDHWQIFLKPHSALATEVQVRYFGSTYQDLTVPKEMAAYISEYIKDLANKGDNNKQSAPAPVLSLVNSTVCIRAKFGTHNTQLSGFFINTEGLIICTTHDLKTSQEIIVILQNGGELNGELIKFDTYKDLALIQCGIESDSFVSLQEGRNLLKIGERIYSIGCPINRIGTIYSGNISGPPRKVNQLPFWQAAIEIHPGSSGSPVFDARGKLVGMVKGRYRGTNSIGFLIPLETILSFVIDL